MFKDFMRTTELLCSLMASTADRKDIRNSFQLYNTRPRSTILLSFSRTAKTQPKCCASKRISQLSCLVSKLFNYNNNNNNPFKLYNYNYNNPSSIPTERAQSLFFT